MKQPSTSVFLALSVVLSLACGSTDNSNRSQSSGGSGGVQSATGGTTATTVLVPPTSKLVISEIMYHPVKETTAEDEHEFVEVFNSGAEAISVEGFKLHVGKTDRLTIPAGVSIVAGGYLVLAKKRDRLLAVTKYALTPELVVGDFSGGLDNGGATVSLLDSSGAVLDSVDYDDDAPWPVGADAFGAQAAFLPELGSYDDHQYMGRSLERYSPIVPSSDPRNWEASPVDGATPGRANSIGGAPKAIVLSTSAVAASTGSKTILAADSVTVTAALSEGAVADLSMEYRLDPVEKTGTTTATMPMALKAGTTSTYEATLPATSANTIVRYRIVGARDGGLTETIGPRATDPRRFYAYFVSPPPASGRSYHLFISPERWTTLWGNISAGRAKGCEINAKWDDTVAASFVYDGQVFDVQTRYQGSNYRRTDGVELRGFSAPGPSQPQPLLALSWRLKFPNYDKLDGLSGINLNKLKQACPGVLNALEGRLMEAAGIPAQSFRFARLYVNGGYYNYVMEAQNIEEDELETFEGQDGSTGDLFKSDGIGESDSSRNAGPWGIGDFSPLGTVCGMTPLARYEFTYSRETHDYKSLTPAGHAGLIALIDQLNQVKSSTAGNAAVRDFFNQYFDVPKLITQYAIRNWAGVWDDGIHNYLPYQRNSDGKWVVFPHDFDCDFGGDPVDCGDSGVFYNDSDLSFYHPESGNGVSTGGPSQLKLQLIRAFREEFAAKVTELGSSLFTEASINSLLDSIMADFDRAAWQAGPARACDLDGRISQAKAWLAERRTFLAGGVR